MESRLQVLLVEDNPTTCKEMSDYMQMQKNMKLIGITDNSPDALSLVKQSLPDVVILNLELHHGAGNGILFLSELNNLSLRFRPYILITTYNSSENTYRITRSLGADFIMYRGKDSYCISYVISFLETIRSSLLSARQSLSPSAVSATTTDSPSYKLNHFICKELDLVGISRNSIAFSYLTDAIALAVEHPEYNIITETAHKHHKSADSVAHAMRHVINRAWLTYPLSEIEQYYTAKIHSNRGAPTTLEFIYYYAGKVKQNLDLW